jgi:hypothetical protein
MPGYEFRTEHPVAALARYIVNRVFCQIYLSSKKTDPPFTPCDACGDHRPMLIAIAWKKVSQQTGS